MLRKQASSILAFAALSAVLVACPAEEKKEETPTTTETAVKTDVKPADTKADEPIVLPPGDGPVAKVNDVDIPRETFNREFTQTIDRYRRARHDVKPALYERLKDNIVRRLVDAEIITQQAKKMSVDVTPEERETKWGEHKKRYGSEEAFKAFLERAGTSEDDVRRQFDNNLIREKVFAKVSEGVTVKPEEIKEFYDKNQARYDEPEQLRASHILIRLPPGATPEVKAEKKKKADEVAVKAKKGKFEDLAKEFGEDPTKDRGGDLGFFTKGRMVKAFEDVAWKLKANQVSGVVETQFGFHIIKRTDYKAARKKPYPEVKEQIERSLEARKRNTAIREALQKWKDESKIEIFVKGDEAVINSAQGKPGEEGDPAKMIQLHPGQQPLLKKDLQIKQIPQTPAHDDHPTQ